MAKDISSLYCEPFGQRHSPLPRFLLQLTFINVFTFFFQIILAPFNQPAFISQILAAIAFGPSVLGKNENLTRKMFPPTSSVALILPQFHSLGIMLFYFMVGLRIDMGIIKHSGKLAVIIGITTYIAPILTTSLSYWFLKSQFTMEESLQKSLLPISALELSTSFHVMSVMLTELNLLNSELGRLAMASSFISDLLGIVYLIVVVFLRETSDMVSMKAVIYTNISRLLLLLVILFLFRPIMSWIIRRTPEGKPLKEVHICWIFVMLMLSSLYGEVNGIDFLSGPLLFGLVIPTGPPIATSLLEKFGYLVSAVLIPSYILNLSFRMDVLHIGLNTILPVVFLVMVATITKLVAVVVTSLYFKMPVVDAVALGLLLNCKGLFNVEAYDRAAYLKHINGESCKVMLIMALLRSSIFTPIVRALYDPSKRYIAYKRHTIQHSKPNAEVRFVACVHNQADVPSIVSLMEITNPTRENPIGLYVLDLVELRGRSMSLFIPHKLEKNPASGKAPSSKQRTRIEKVMNVFGKLEVQNLGNMAIQYFTAISPYVTIHDDICTLALEKSVSFVILPFHRSDSLAMRTINKNVLEKAPCSVGILISHKSPYVNRFNICLFFINGPDDREALAYAARMVQHPEVKLRVVQIRSTNEDSDNNLIEKKLDMQAISDIKMKSDTNPRIEYKEENVEDVAGTTLVIGSPKNRFDIIIVGRGHDEDSPILKGLSEWCEFKELGVIGDLLISTDYNEANASVLVVQQQASAVEKV